MGIRFYCPNGHKLNVKEHLAGKVGFCPECGARLTIPFHSTRKSSRELAEEQNGAVSGSQPERTSQKSTNPMLEDQTVVWYVQAADGERYGPTSGEVLQAWIQEHRIGPDMLLWREGWENWLPAKDVFPEMLGDSF